MLSVQILYSYAKNPDLATEYGYNPFSNAGCGSDPKIVFSEQP
jgi:hypothetical protein